MLDGVDVDRVAGQARRVVDAADMLDRCRHLEAAEIGASETDTEVGWGRLERKRDLLAGMETNPRAGIDRRSVRCAFIRSRTREGRCPERKQRRCRATSARDASC